MSWSPLDNTNATILIRRPVCPCCGKVMCIQRTRKITIQDRGVAALARVRSYRCKVHKQTIKVVVI